MKEISLWGTIISLQLTAIFMGKNDGGWIFMMGAWVLLIMESIQYLLKN